MIPCLYRSFEATWDVFLQGKRYLNITYEDLVADSRKVIRDILEFLDIRNPDIDAAFRGKVLIKLDHPQKALFVERMKRDYLN